MLARAASNYTFEADVSKYVTKNASYQVTNVPSGNTDGSDPWASGSVSPEADGASLIAIYANSSMPYSTVQVYGGAQMTNGNTISGDFTGFVASPSPVAKTTFIVGDGQNSPDGPATFDSSTLAGSQFDGTDPIAGAPLSMGNLWDTKQFDVSSLVAPGSTDTGATIVGTQDCLVCRPGIPGDLRQARQFRCVGVQQLVRLRRPV